MHHVDDDLSGKASRESGYRGARNTAAGRLSPGR